MTVPMSPVSQIHHPLFNQHQIAVYVKRDDLIHPVISGNKWRKLEANIAEAKASGAKGIISFGGSYSNHIHALAYACYQQQIPVIGFIRGEPSYADNYTLSWAKHWRMKLVFVDRQTYRLRDNLEYLTQLQNKYPNHLIIPEGGSNSLALKGVAKIIMELEHQQAFDSLLLPLGSGGTLAGLINADNNQHQILAINVLKGANYLYQQVKSLLPKHYNDEDKWQIVSGYHCGGYAKFSSDDLAQIQEISAITGIPLEPVYSGKMMLALFDLIKKGYFPKGHKIMLLHTGGLQGLGGMLERGLITEDYLKVIQWPVPPVPPAL